MQQCMYEIKICDIYDLQKCLMQTWVDSEQNVIEVRLTSGASVSDHVWMLVANTLNTFREIIVRLYYVVHQNIL